MWPRQQSIIQNGTAAHTHFVVCDPRAAASKSTVFLALFSRRGVWKDRGQVLVRSHWLTCNWNDLLVADIIDETEKSSVSLSPLSQSATTKAWLKRSWLIEERFGVGYLWPAGDSNLNKTNTPNRGIKRAAIPSCSSLSISPRERCHNNRVTKFTAEQHNI